MGFKHDFLHGWYWSDESTTPVPSKYDTYTAPARNVNPNYAQGWVCPKCGRVNAPWVSSCPCYLSSNVEITY